MCRADDIWMSSHIHVTTPQLFSSAPRRRHALLVFPLAAVIGFTLSTSLSGLIARFSDHRGASTHERRYDEGAERERDNTGSTTVEPDTPAKAEPRRALPTPEAEPSRTL